MRIEWYRIENFKNGEIDFMKSQKCDFVFEYEVKPREFNSICLVAAYLRNKGYSVAVVNSWQSIYNKPKKYQAEVAVISACYNDGTYDYFTGHIASFRKVVDMRWEQVLINYYYQQGNDGLYDYKGIGQYTRHVCWGEKEKAWLNTSFGIDHKYLKVVGYLPLDFYREELQSLCPSRSFLFGQYGLDPNKKTLLFVSSFAAIDLPETEKHGSGKVFSVKEDVSRESQRIVLEWFGRFAQRYPDIQIVYRYHPSEKNNESVRNIAKSNKNIYVIQDAPLAHWIMTCDKIYNWCSTSIIEMLSSGKDVYLCRPIQVPEKVDYGFFHDVQCINSYEKFEESALEPKMEKLPVNEQLLAQWYDIQDDPVYKRIGDWLIETYHDASYVSRPSKNNIYQSQFWKKIKMPIRRAIAYTKLADYCSKYFGKNVLARRLQKIQTNVLAEKKYREAVQEKDGYIQSKYRLNSTTEEEIEYIIAQYQKLITSHL